MFSFPWKDNLGFLNCKKTVIFSSAVVALYGCGATNPLSSSTSSISSITSSSSSSSSDPDVADEVLVLALNAGGTSPATFEGVEYRADRFGSGGSTQTVSDPIAGVTADALYQSERFGDSRYEIPVSNATYSIVLHFAELYHTSANARAFSVTVEGQSALEDLDLFSEVGHDGAYEHRVDNVPVTDGKLTIDLVTITDNATISGIEGLYLTSIYAFV